MPRSRAWKQMDDIEAMFAVPNALASRESQLSP